MDARALQHFQHADMRHALGTAATEYDSHPPPFMVGIRTELRLLSLTRNLPLDVCAAVFGICYAACQQRGYGQKENPFHRLLVFI